jgi:hypothetical protein
MAPIAARLVVKIPRKKLGIAVGLMIVVLNGYRIILG